MNQILNVNIDAEMWKLDLSPDKDTPIKYETLLTREKRFALREKLHAEKKEKSRKCIDFNAGTPNLEKCPICGKEFQQDQLSIHGQKCASDMFD